MTTISGSSGPFGTPGDYGRNALYNVSQTPADQLAKTTIRYTPADAKTKADAFGYAQEDIKLFDKNKDGALSLCEFRNVFGNDKKVADKMFKALDTDNNKKIDTLEDAAYLMFQDNSAPQYKKAVAERVKHGLMTKDEAKKVLNKFNKIEPKKTAADGQATADERTFADGMIQAAPETSKQILEGFRDMLEKPYEKFQTDQKLDAPEGGDSGNNNPDCGASPNNPSNPGCPGTPGSTNNQDMMGAFTSILTQLLKVVQMLNGKPSTCNGGGMSY